MAQINQYSAPSVPMEGDDVTVFAQVRNGNTTTVSAPLSSVLNASLETTVSLLTTHTLNLQGATGVILAGPDLNFVTLGLSGSILQARSNGLFITADVIAGTKGVSQIYGPVGVVPGTLTATNGFHYTFADTAATSVLFVNNSSSLATGTITLAPALYDGQQFEFTARNAIGSVTFNTSGTSYVGRAITALVAGEGHGFYYMLSANRWVQRW